MALNEKYTWGDFLREHPEKKGLKRTSPDGKKAFETAYKAFVKEYIKTRLGRLEKQQQRATKSRDELVVRQKAIKKAALAKRFQVRVGQKDHAIAVIGQQIASTREIQKQF